MRNLFAFLWKYHFFVLFVILEIISLTFLFNSYSYHRSLKYNVVSDVSGSIYSTYSNIVEYFSLKSANRVLAEENALLRNKLKSSFNVNDSITDYADTLFQFKSAKIVSNSISKPNNFFLINKGLNHGLEKEMGVISSSGVAGIIIGTSDNYAVVMSILHQNIRISGRIKNGGQLVNLVWPGFNHKICKVIDIPSHVILHEGDTVITSGNSLIFPEGILIGKIIQQDRNKNEELSEATLSLATDFSTLKHVYVIKNKRRDEQVELLENTNNE